MSEIEGRVVVITGASRGLGAALAEAFAREGARLALCAKSREALEAIRTRVVELGAHCVAEAVDVTDAAAVRHWIRHGAIELGAPSVLVNNASVLGPRQALADFPLAGWRQVMEVNLTGTLIVTQAVLPAMLANGGGSIINLSSGAALPPRAEWGAYAVSKSGVEALSRNLARELEGTGVRVNIVDPGAMRTEMRALAYPEEDPCTVKEPRSIASLFLWLASEESADVTGARFQADEWISERG